MILSGTLTQELVSLINESLSAEELIRVVRYSLDTEYEDVVAPNATKIHAVFVVIEYSRKTRSIRKLIENVIRENATRAAELRSVLVKVETPEINGSGGVGVGTVVDPLGPYFPRGEPFVDRAQLTQSLQSLWDLNQSGVLVVRGARYSGRSHSWWRILEAARQAGVATERVDVSLNPGGWTVIDIVERVGKFLKMDREAFKDPLAQAAAQGKALISAMTDQFRERDPAAGRVCIVLDGLDRPGVDRSIIELVEHLISAILQGSLPGLSLIILGYGEHWEQAFGYRINTEQIDPIERRHVEQWLTDLLLASGRTVNTVKITDASDAILEGLAQPIDAPKMIEFRARAKRQAVALLRGQ